jgi:hypothetical protein
MGLAFVREHIQSALLAAIHGKRDLYKVGEKIKATNEEQMFAARACELVLRAMSRAEKLTKRARRVPGEAPKGDGRPQQPQQARPAKGTRAKGFATGFIGRAAAEIVEDENDDQPPSANGEGEKQA